jgi:hypothetical protein
MGGAESPRFVYARELAFEARLQALADPAHRGDVPYRERHVQSALEQHIAETLLSSQRIEPAPTERELAAQIDLGRAMLAERAHGVQALERARRAEGLEEREVRALLRRQALASLYLDRMVSPMLKPSQAELLNVHRSVESPFRGRPFAEIKDALQRWYTASRLSQAVQAYYRNARSRLKVQILEPLPLEADSAPRSPTP